MSTIIENNDHPTCIETGIKLEQTIFKLTQENFDSSIEQILDLFDSNFPYTYNLIICYLVYSAFCSRKNSDDLYLDYLEVIQQKEEEINKNNSNIVKIFGNHMTKMNTQESYYLIDKMIERNLINSNIISNINSKYFSHYRTELENRKDQIVNSPLDLSFFNDYKELSKNNWELHKKYIKEGHNPNEIAKIIRNDEIEKLQEISSQPNFDFNQTIEPSLYERCSFVNQENVSLIDYAAFFGSIKCFKFLLLNKSNIVNTGKYAIAGGNLEIVHLCQQNHVTFENGYKIAIEFHQNDIFKYIHENKLEKLDENKKDFNNLARFCISKTNFEIFSFLNKEEGIEINDAIINEAAKVGNLYLIKRFLQKIQTPKNILFLALGSENDELVKYFIEEKGINVNCKNIYLFYSMFILMIGYFKSIFGN